MTLLSDAHRVAQALADYDDKTSRREGVVLRQPPSAQLIDQMKLHDLARDGGLTGEVLSQFLGTYLDGTIRLRDPRAMGHQTAFTNEAGAFGAFIDGYVNNPMAINEMGPAANAIEQFYLDWMLSKLSWNEKAAEGLQGGGVLTHGGSLANLTALCAARSAMAPDAWKGGNSDNLIIIVPAVSHYSVARAAGIMGLGQDAIIPLPVDGDGRARADLLPDLIACQQEAGKVVMAVVGNACQTALGLFDPLREMALACRKAGVWFHVDGAHGAAALLSPKLKHLMDGAERADSLIWDAHKMLRTPCLCAAVLVRDHRRLDTAFAQDASYLFHEKDNPGFDFLGRSVECTKASLGLKAFMALAQEGEAGLTTYIENLVALTAEAAKIIEAESDFEMASETEFNIICFRKITGGETCSLELRKRLLERGNYYTTYVEHAGERWLRLTLMNPKTIRDDIHGLLEEVRLVSEMAA